MKRLLGPIMMLMLLIACNSSNNTPDRKQDEKKGGLLVMNQFQGFSTLHPPASYENSSIQLGGHVFETLVGYDPESLELSPMLASSWEVNENSTKFVFTLREDVYFHDDACFEGGQGRQMTPTDVLFCFKTLCQRSALNTNSSLMTDYVTGAQSFFEKGLKANEAEIPGLYLDDSDRLVMELDEPNREFLNLLTHYGTSIYPAEAMLKYGRQVGLNPVGTGPFVMKTLRPDEICVLTRNGRYWGVDESGNSLPYLMGLKVGFVKTGRELSQSMENGLLHLVMDADIVEGGEQVSAVVDRHPERYATSYHVELETVYLAFLNDEGVFSDKRVRQAFAHALDKNLITQEALSNSGEPGHYGLVPPGFHDYPYAEVKSPALDLVRAQELLSEAGFPEGIGFPVVTLQIQNRFKDVVVAQEIQRQILEHLGISLSITAIPRQQHFQRAEDKETVLWLDNWIADYRTPQNFLNMLMSKNTPEEGDSYLNTYRFLNPEYDALIDDAVHLKENEARNRNYAKADRQLMEDAGITPIYYEKNKIVTHTAVKNLHPPMFGRFDLRRVYIEE